MTPFKAVYCRDPPSIIKYTVSKKDPPNVQEQLLQRDHTLSQLKFNLTRAQQHMKVVADTKRKHVQFQVGDMVLVKLQPYRQHSVQLRKNQKLGLHYFGPFPITEQIGHVAYKTQLP